MPIIFQLQPKSQLQFSPKVVENLKLKIEFYLGTNFL